MIDQLANDVSLDSRLSNDLRETYQNPSIIQRVLGETKTIAIVGLSPNTQRPSHFVGSYIHYAGYRVAPVNPRATEIFGRRSYPDLLSIDQEETGPIDMVNVFRRPEECLEIAQQAIEIGAKTLWLQLGVVNEEAAQLAQKAGLTVIMDRCIKMEHGRYNGSMHWVGMNTEIVTAKKARQWF
ncbi:CoA-binding protein [Chloroflexi bacterium TSY]|nr:CoA-binding protein [Chloroflexi bacterium TSY]